MGTGPGRGMGLMFVLSGMLLLVASLLAFSNPRIRQVEEELPDAISAEAVEEAEVSLQAA